MTAGRWAAAAMATTGTVGVVCQFLQRTDPRFPLVYFTVGSAILAVVAGLVFLVTPSRAEPLLIAAAPAVLLSALVFAAVIAPAQNGGPWFAPHDDGPVRVAIAAMHGVLPVLAVIVAWRSGGVLPPRTRRRWVRVTLVWPMIYLLGTVVFQVAGWAVSPYPFLRPSELGWPVTVMAVVAAAALLCGLALGLRFVTERGRGTSPAGG